MPEEQELAYNLIKPFGPFIGDFTIPSRIVDELNAFTDAVIADQSRSDELDLSHHLAGEVSQEIVVAEDVLHGEVGRYLMEMTATYVGGATRKKMTRFTLMRCWIVRSFAGDYNPIHNHRGHISGTGYLKVPPQIGSPEGSRKSGLNAGCITFSHGADQFVSPGHYSVTPKVGHMLIFPHYLNHSVYPFSGEGERRSFAFNAMIDDDIFDIYAARAE